MNLSVPVVARTHADFIKRNLAQYARELNPASVEDSEIVRRAVFSVRNKSVLFERFNTASNKLFSVVQDVRPAEVTVHFNDERLHCTCPQALCRHKLGVLLGMYQYFGSVQEWRAKWADQKSVELHTLSTERTPQSWAQMVDEVMDHLLPTGRRVESYVVTTFLENAHAKLSRYMPLEREWQPIYRLYMEIAVLNKIWTHFLTTDSPIHSDYFQYAVDRRRMLMSNFIEELDISRLFATDPFYDAIQTQLRLFVQQPEGYPTMRLQLYLECWSQMFYDAKRAEQELALLEDVDSDLPAELLRLVPKMVLKADLSGDVQPAYLHIYTEFVEFALSIDAQSYAERLLRQMLPHLQNYIKKMIPRQQQQFIMHIHSLYKEIALSEAEEMQLFSAFGRYGVLPYSNYLLQHERMDEWVALQLMYRSSIPYLEAHGLKEVLEVQPEVTLPLYHLYAMDEVAQKSRTHYKQAVRIWKQMKRAAKKAGKLAYFETYIEQVSKQFKRLRALQEELDKANLRGDQL